MELLHEISTALQKGDDKTVAALTEEAIEQEIPARRILEKGLLPGMKIVGDRFRNYEIFLPEVLLAAKAMHAGIDLLKPLFIKDDVPTIGKVVLGTVQGDLHDLGKNLVSIMLRGAGFEIVDLGKDVPLEKFIETAEREHADLIGMSALLTTTMPGMKKVVDLLNEKKLNGKIKVIIGGAPVSEGYAQQIGADAYGYDALNAVDLAKQLIATD